MQEGQLAIIWLLLSTLALFTMIFGLRYISNKENMAMIEKGINPREVANRPAPYKNLKWALVLMGAGIGLFLAFVLDNYILVNSMNRFHHDDGSPAIYFALIAIGAGAGLFGSYRIEKKWWDERKG